MKSFVISVGDFLGLAPSDGQFERFDIDVTQFVIPKYQREYTWNDVRVKSLIQDIRGTQKFLGNIFLNKTTHSYEIVDGQQRITTLLLTLIAIHNAEASDGTGLTMNQQVIRQKIIHNGQFVLANDSIGEYLHIEGNRINLNILAAMDIYNQKLHFSKLYSFLTDCIAEIEHQDFLRKLFNSRFLVLINDEHNGESIEQIFLDINEKSQHLQPEDIFKGYCFKKYWSDHHDELKVQWINLKSCSLRFKEFGYENLSKYLYHYLLSFTASKDISEDLRVDQVHFLENKNPDDIHSLLADMISYGQHLIEFNNNLKRVDYKFNDVACDGTTHSPQSVSTMKLMFQFIILNSPAQYQKFSLLMLVHHLLKYESLAQQMSWGTFQKIVSNYFVYCLVFIGSSGNKDKNRIQRGITDVLVTTNISAEEKIAHITTIAQNLRREAINSYQISRKFNNDISFAFYSILDFYDANDNKMKDMYDPNQPSRKEHLIIHDNRGKRVSWISVHGNHSTYLNHYDHISDKKSRINNYLALDPTLNENLGDIDIVEKDRLIRQHYGTNIPKHVSVFLTYINQLPSLSHLRGLKSHAITDEELTLAYQSFVNEYFSDETWVDLASKLNEEFLNSFRNG